MALLRPLDSMSIDTQDFLKSITESKKITVEKIVKDYLFDNKKQQTISQIQTTNSWSKTQSGVRPEKRYIFQDVVNRVKENPDKKFSMSDVWAPSNLVTIISKFNRHPSMTSAITHLNFANGLNWSSFDTPSMYLAEDENGDLLLVSAKGGHRTVMGILTFGFACDLPVRITYIGTLDLEEVCKQAAIDHHIDCNKRNNQTADDRIVSGVEAEDYALLEVMQSLIDFKLYVKEDLMKPDMIKDFRKCTSWQSIKISIKNNGYAQTKYAVEHLIKNTQKEAIISQSVEVVANFKNKFQKQIDKVFPKSYDSLSDFIEWYFSDYSRNQHTLRSGGDTDECTIELCSLFNIWCEKEETLQRISEGRSMNGYKKPITYLTALKAYGDEDNLPKNTKHKI